MTKIRKAILLVGYIDPADTAMWRKWFETVEKIFQQHNLLVYGVEVEGDGYTGRVYQRKRLTKRLNESFQKNVALKRIGLYAYASKDNKYVSNTDVVFFIRYFNMSKEGRIWCEFNENTFSEKDINEIIDSLQEFINMTYGEYIQKDTSLDSYIFIGRMINYYNGRGPIEEDNDKHIKTIRIIKEEQIKE